MTGSDRGKRFIMALDQGTTSSRCIIYDRKGNIMGSSQREFRQIFPESGWVEHDPIEIWDSQLDVARRALKDAGISADDIASIGITNQRETTVVWEKATGRPVYNAIVWQCRRTASYCKGLKDKGLEDPWRKKTGLPIDPYFSATKLRWILDKVEGAKGRAKNGELLFGTIDTWLLWNLTGGTVHATEASNASRTMMFNINELKWDEDILETLGIPECMLPRVMDSSGIFGETAEELFGKPIVIGGIAGDQQAALFGQACFDRGMAKNTFGTGGFLLINTGDSPVRSENGLITTVAWKIGDEVTYALEGSVFVSGAAIQWLRDGMSIIASASESEEMCRSVEDTEGVYFVPAFAGLGAPYWDPYARGMITGLSRGTKREHIVRAAVEAMAYQTVDLIDAARSDMTAVLKRGTLGDDVIKTLRVDGGAAKNDFLLQFQADISNVDVTRPFTIETTSLGAAYLAGLAVGYWEDQGDIASGWQAEKIFKPELDPIGRRDRLESWHESVARCMSRSND